MMGRLVVKWDAAASGESSSKKSTTSLGKTTLDLGAAFFFGGMATEYTT